MICLDKHTRIVKARLSSGVNRDSNFAARLWGNGLREADGLDKSTTRGDFHDMPGFA